MKTPAWAPAAVTALALVVLVAGARVFWFEVDDAFIAYRYVAQAHQGHGYVWNSPPFRPVEGYTSFAWVALLDLTWRVTGLPPTRSACPLSLACMMGAFALVARALWATLSTWRSTTARLSVLGLALVWLATHRTFVMFCTSGLETGLWTLLCTAWALSGVSGRMRAMTASAALMMLTRPEGALAVLVTVAAAAAHAAPRRAWKPLAVTLAPLALPLAHVLWRRMFYGAWVPNTAVAKLVSAWPEAGAVYVLSYLVEYGLVPLAAVASLAAWRGRARLRGSLGAHGPLAVAVGAGIYLAFYVVIAGGDLFEYRPLTPFVPWIALGAVSALTRVAWSTRAIAMALAAQIALSAYLPWSHWSLSEYPASPSEVGARVVAVGPSAPALLRPWATLWDSMQAWLIERYINTRHGYHRAGTALLHRGLPSPEASPRPPRGRHAVVVAEAVGVIGWSLPYIDVIDDHGLCDWVTARTRPPAAAVRHLAHERVSPVEYLRAFHPYLHWIPGVGLQRRPTGSLLSDDEIRAVERTWRARIASGR